MAKGKRIADTHSKKSEHGKFKKKEKINFKKYFILFLVIVIVAILGYLSYKHIPTLISKDKSDNSEFNSVSSKNIEDAKTVEGLNSISVTGINISTSDKGASIIEFNFKNTSDADISETKAHFYALGADDKIIFGMPLTIPKIEANSITTYKVLCTSDLSEVKDYKISVE